MKTKEEILKQPLEEFIEENLPPRMARFSTHRWKCEWVPTVQTIFKSSDPYMELFRFRGIGKIAADEITKKLRQLGFEIKGPLPRHLRPGVIEKHIAWRRKQLAEIDDKIARNKSKLSRYYQQRKETLSKIEGLQA